MTLHSPKVMILALLFLATISVPNLYAIPAAQANHPLMIYEPAMSKQAAIFAPNPNPNPLPSMPLPTPTPGLIPKPAPVSGVLRVLIIAAYFSDINYTTSLDRISAEWFGGVGSYYKEVSFGAITLQGDIRGWYKLPYPESHYGRDCLSIDDADCSGSDQSWQIANDAALLAQKDGVSFANYDYFVFIHSGNGEESSGVKDDVWSVTYLGGVWVRTNTRTLSKFNICPELEASGAVPQGVYTHEFGHQLGLPDLYNTNNGRTILGPWSLMDKGLWNGDPAGSSPANMEAWSKIQLGFITGPMLATANAGVTSTFTIAPTEVASSNVHAVEVPLQPTSNPAQYYLIEVRADIGFDSALPAFGVLITYVDNTALIGRVHVMDGHPSVAALEDAVWDVGQSFTDSKNGLSITVTGKTGSSYQVTVNRGTGQPPPPQYQNQTTYIDLGITGISDQPQVITSPNTTVTITVEISDLGTQGATNVPVQVNLDGRSYTSTQISVGAGSSTQTTFTWISVLGSHVFQVTIDPNHTINDTNRANNVATFTINVGPILVINVPANVTAAGNLWVLINGVKYNFTSNQFQTSVPTGTVTVEIQPAVNTSIGVRQSFAGWSDGILTNPRQIAVNSNTTLQATYETQYLLTVNQNGGTTTPSGWYDPNSTVQVTAISPANITVQVTRLLFSRWSGDANTNSSSLAVNVTKPMTLNANWIRQFYVTIISPAGTPTGSGWYNSGDIATVAVQSTVEYSNGSRQIFEGWNSTLLGNNPTGQVYVNAPVTLSAAWKTQYLVTLQSQYGTPTGSGWYDAGSNIPVSVQGEVDYSNATRRIFSGWTGDYTSSSPSINLQLDAPKTLNAEWTTEYMVTFKVAGLANSTIVKLNLNNATYDLSMNSNYQAWYPEGSTINAALNQTVVQGFMANKFVGWQNATGVGQQEPFTVKGPETYIGSYSNELILPPIPGFPLEGIFAGVLLGSLMLVISRRRRGRLTER